MNHRSTTKHGALERRLTFLCLALIAGGVILVARMPERIAAMERQRKYDSEFYEFADLFGEIYGRIREIYVKEVPGKQLFEGAINGMFATLDPHSSWLPPDAQEMMTRDTEGDYSGVGLHITLDKHKILTVISPIVGSPGARAGVLPWDRIIEIEGKSTENITLMDAVKKLTGPTGSSVRIKVWREGVNRPLTFTLKRENIKVNAVFSKILDDAVGYLRIVKFQEDTAAAVRKELKTFNEKKVRGVIVDLRFDAGGLLDRAVEVCDMFLPKGQVIVSIKGRNKNNNRVFYSLEEPICKQPLVVLVNHGSASASEIFAGAMKDTSRGVIVGPKGSTTYGKGSVQTISVVNKSLDRDKNGDVRPSGIRLTTALYYTPSGVSIHEKGIKPDIGVELPEGHELQLLRHGLLGDPNQIDPTDVGDDEANSAAEGNGKKQGVPKTLMFNDDENEGPGEQEVAPDTTPTTDSQTTTGSKTKTGVKATSHSLEQLLNNRKALKQDTQGKRDKFRDIMLDEAIKYLKVILISEGRKVA